MACRRCGSQLKQGFDAELTASLPHMKGMKLSPIYASQQILVCLDCGFTELSIPAPELDRVKKAIPPANARDAR